MALPSSPWVIHSSVQLARQNCLVVALHQALFIFSGFCSSSFIHHLLLITFLREQNGPLKVGGGLAALERTLCVLAAAMGCAEGCCLPPWHCPVQHYGWVRALLCVYVLACVCVCEYMCVYRCVCACLYVCLCLCVCVCMYVCIQQSL